jgi:hypothetical protein
MPYRPTRKELLELINSIEANGGDASELRRELKGLDPQPRTRKHGSRFQNEEEPTTAERLDNRVGDLFNGGISDELVAKLVELDRSHSLKDLRAMCVEVGLSAGGDKKELAAKLVAEGIL